MIQPADRFVTVGGLRLHLLDWGGGGRPPLLLLHGFTGSAHALDTLAIALQPHFHVWALDQRGHGDSDPAEVYGAVPAFGDLSGVIDQLGLAPVILVGFSMGGRNAMYFSSRRPGDVQRLVVVDIGPEISARAATTPAGPPEPAAWDSVEQAAQHLHRGNPHPGIHYFRWVASHSLRARRDGKLVWKWHPSVKERRDPATDLTPSAWWAVLRAIPVPTLVLRGAESPILDRDVGERMARELPRGRFVEIPGAVHMLHEDNPEAVVAALLDFLAGIF
jgi:pimeloyl-ACP methyl ester carboxylesterase